MTALNLIFAGTPGFAAVALEALLHTEHTIRAVYTQPDRPAGRGHKITTSLVKQLAVAHHLPLYQPSTLRDPAAVATLKTFSADMMIVAAYGLLLPKTVLEAFPLGCINIHASLLPRYRGASPIQHAILAGDTATGITIMRMDEGLDTGPILYQKSCPIAPSDTSQTLYDRLAVLGAEALLFALKNLDNLQPHPQESHLASYAPKIAKQDARIHWGDPADVIARKIRAMDPWPIAFTELDTHCIRIYEAEVLQSNTRKHPGEILNADAKGLEVATGEHTLRILKMQLPGGRILPIADILNAKKHLFLPGVIFN